MGIVWLNLERGGSFWRNGEILTFTNFATDAEDAWSYKKCTVIQGDGTWAYADCLTQNYVICEQTLL